MILPARSQSSQLAHEGRTRANQHRNGRPETVEDTRTLDVPAPAMGVAPDSESPCGTPRIVSRMLVRGSSWMHVSELSRDFAGPGRELGAVIGGEQDE